MLRVCVSWDMVACGGVAWRGVWVVGSWWFGYGGVVCGRRVYDIDIMKVSADSGLRRWFFLADMRAWNVRYPIGLHNIWTCL